MLLDLNGRTEMVSSSRDDDEIATLDLVLAVDYLPDGTNRVDDRRAGRVGGEGGQRLELATAIRLA